MEASAMDQMEMTSNITEDIPMAKTAIQKAKEAAAIKAAKEREIDRKMREAAKKHSKRKLR